jgi:NADP-dependent 3-hydroxy acid dehydrogenase YdfG
VSCISNVSSALPDVSDYAATAAALQQLQDSAGAIEVAVCNAGLAIPKTVTEQPLEEFQTTMNVRTAACMQDSEGNLATV